MILLQLPLPSIQHCAMPTANQISDTTLASYSTRSLHDSYYVAFREQKILVEPGGPAQDGGTYDCDAKGSEGLDLTRTPIVEINQVVWSWKGRGFHGGNRINS